MKKYFKAILIVLLFVVTSNFTQVSGFTPIREPLYKGIYVDIDYCNESSDYFIDIVVQEEAADDHMTLAGGGYIYPSAIDSSEYGDFDNEWISLSKFYVPGPTIREDCAVNFYGNLEELSEIPYPKYKVVVYENDEILEVSESYYTRELSYGDDIGQKILFRSPTKDFVIEEMHSIDTPVRPLILGLSIVSIFLMPFVIFCFVIYVIIEPIICFTVPGFRKDALWVLLYNLIMLIVAITLYTFNAVVLLVLLSIVLIKIRHLKIREFRGLKATMIFSFGILFLASLYYLIVNLI